MFTKKRLFSCCLVLVAIFALMATKSFAAKLNTIGVPSGAVYHSKVRNYVGNVTFYEFENLVSLFDSVRMNKIDGAVVDEKLAKVFIAKHPDQLKIKEVFDTEVSSFVTRDNYSNSNKINSIIKRLKANGELDKLIAKWNDSTNPNLEFGELTYNPNYTGKNGVLRVGIQSEYFPACYNGNKNPMAGLEVDLIRKIAYELDMRLTVKEYNFLWLIPALTSDKIDIACGRLVSSEIKDKRVDFSLPYYTHRLGLVCCNTGSAAGSSVLSGEYFSNLFQAFWETFSGSIVIKGACISLIFTVLITIFGHLITISLCVLKIQQINFIVKPVECLLSLIFTIPNFLYLTVVVFIICSWVPISPFLSLIFAWSVKETVCQYYILENAFKSLPKGQLEAGLALGFSRIRVFFTILLPQALRRALPSLLSNFNAVLSYTAVLGFFGLVDLTQATMEMYSSGTEPLFPMLLACIIYFLIIAGSSRLTNLFVSWLDPKTRIIKGSKEVIPLRVYIKKIIVFAVSLCIILAIAFPYLFNEYLQFNDQNNSILPHAATTATSATNSNTLSINNEPLTDSQDSIGISERFSECFIQENRWKLFVKAILIIGRVSLGFASLGLLLALLFLVMSYSKNKAIANFPLFFEGMLGAVPPILLLLIFYYIVFAQTAISPELVAIIVLAIKFSIPVFKALLVGKSSIQKGQIEAGLALGFTPKSVFYKIELPQEIRVSLPVVCKELCTKFKLTSLLGFLSIPNPMIVACTIYAYTFDFLTPMLCVVLIYYVFCECIIYFQRCLSLYLNKGRALA